MLHGLSFTPINFSQYHMCFYVLHDHKPTTTDVGWKQISTSVATVSRQLDKGLLPAVLSNSPCLFSLNKSDSLGIVDKMLKINNN